MEPKVDRHSLDARARRRVGRKLGFYIHATVFVIVNLGLYTLNGVIGGTRWSHFPLWGWGLGLAIHGLVTFASLRGEGVHRRMVEREVDRLRSKEPGA